MPLEVLQQFSDGPVVRDRIRNGYDSPEPEVPVIVACQYGPTVRRVAARVLHVVEALRIGLPDVDLGAGHGLPGLVPDGAEDQTLVAVGVAGYGIAIVDVVGVVRVEGPEDCSVRRILWLRVVDRVDEERHAEYVTQKNEFLLRPHLALRLEINANLAPEYSHLADIGTSLSHGCKKVDSLHPLVGAEPSFPHVIMHVLH